MAAVLEGFRSDPAGSAVFTDFDGTLAAIMTDPAAAGPVPGAVEVVVALAGVLHRVAVISGRPVDVLQRHFSGDVELSGLYGLEGQHEGRRVEHPEAAEWRAVITAVVTGAASGLPAGARLEPKGVSLTVHYREHPEVQPAVEEWARAQAAEHGLVVRPARRSVELHPPIEADKGTVLLRLADGIRRACFLGDDIGDLPAFRALDVLRGQGVETVKVGVVGPETPPEVAAEVDLTVDGPEGAVAFLRSLLS